MAHRKPRVLLEASKIAAFAEREDLTEAERWRVMVGALLAIVEQLSRLADQLDEAHNTGSKALDVLLKQHAALLLDRTDPRGG